jgi:SAM-dependent methyltransferase
VERAPKECICCGGTERSFLIKIGDWTIYKCSGCGLGVLDPRPDSSELGALYKESYFASHYGDSLAPGSPGMSRRISQEAHRIRFFGKFKRSGRVLDIGCGRGYFLHACSIRGYDVAGHDVSEDAAASVQNALGIPVKAGIMRDELFEPESIDVVTMWHSLEHTADPGKCLDQARKWLRPDGLLVVDVPNHEGTDARRKWDRWEDWDLPYHLYHFTPSSLGDLLVRHGFRVTASKSSHSECVRNRLKKIPLVGILARPVAKFFSGAGYAVIARKANRLERENADASK